MNLTRKDVSREDAIILVEGYMDAVSLYQAGIRNISASLGTALTENQARLIKRYTKNVILSYDADQAGQNAAFRGLDILYREGCRARVLKVTDGKDPDEFIKKTGRNAFLDLVDHAIPYGDFKLNMVKPVSYTHLTSGWEGLAILTSAQQVMLLSRPQLSQMQRSR